jgi:hypothetical protein
MTNADWAAIFVPIVAGILLAVWLTAVLRADTHPDIKHHRKPPGYEVTGGAFNAHEGGRQLMPIPGQRPAAGMPGTAASPAGQEQPGAAGGAVAGSAAAGSAAGGAAAGGATEGGAAASAAADRRHEQSAPG